MARVRRSVGKPLPRSFFARDADVVARDLVGRVLVHDAPGGRRAARITETEAYFGPPGTNAHLLARGSTLARRIVKEGDAAAHSFRGPTERNRVMFGPPGYWYVYLVYGMHECANVVTGPPRDHQPQAVLLRGGEPIEGADRMPRQDLSGPAKLCEALGITRKQYGLDATAPPLWFEAGSPMRDAEVAATPRIGIGERAADMPLRFVARKLIPRRRVRDT